MPRDLGPVLQAGCYVLFDHLEIRIMPVGSSYGGISRFRMLRKVEWHRFRWQISRFRRYQDLAKRAKGPVQSESIFSVNFAGFLSFFTVVYSLQR